MFDDPSSSGFCHSFMNSVSILIIDGFLLQLNCWAHNNPLKGVTINWFPIYFSNCDEKQNKIPMRSSEIKTVVFIFIIIQRSKAASICWIWRFPSILLTQKKLAERG